MPKSAPIVKAFNSGEFSLLVEARVDLERHGSSCKSLLNGIAAPQGPFIARSGTFFQCESYNHANKSELVPFVFGEREGEGESSVIEFSDQKIRICEELGLLVYSPVSATVSTTAPFVITSATLGASVGDQVVLLGFDDEYSLNNVQANIIAKSVNDYTIDLTFPTGLSAPGGAVQVSKVFDVTSPYAENDLLGLNSDQSLDTLYLTTLSKKPYTLKRKDTYDWEFEAIKFIDGPYMDINDTATDLTPDITGKAIPTMTGASAPSGYVASADSEASGHNAWHAFDEDDDTYWSSNAEQKGTLTIQVPTAFACDGYSIRASLTNNDPTFTNRDSAPLRWAFMGSNDGTNWTILDRKEDYLLYDNNKSVFFEIPNETTYLYYRIKVDKCVSNGSIKPQIRTLVLRNKSASTITFTASSTSGINNNQGFLSTDVGRLMRVKGSDNAWRNLEITAVNSTTEVEATLLGEPLPSIEPIRYWRLGYWSDTTGYPNVVAFHQDRLFFGGSDIAPDLIVGSVTGDYLNMAQETTEGSVLDTSAIVIRLNARVLSRVRWFVSTNKGLLVGTGSQEYAIVANEGKTLTPSKVSAERNTARGSSFVAPVSIDDQTVFVSRSGRSLREYAFVFEADNFKAPSMSLLASHLGVSPFKKMQYAQEPYSVIWIIREDGQLVGLTYNRDENVIGWHRHTFQDGVVESIAVIPSNDQRQDYLYLLIKRNIDGQEKRYIERLTRFWDFGMTISDAHFADSAVKYTGASRTVLHGLLHLNGRTVYALADGKSVGPYVVNNGSITLDITASEILVGLGYESFCETSRIDSGSGDGTAIGKKTRMNEMSALLWNSYGGEVGVWDDEYKEVKYDPINYKEDVEDLTEFKLYDGIVGPITPALGYTKRSTVFFRKPENELYPLNVVALLPRMNTYDG